MMLTPPPIDEPMSDALPASEVAALFASLNSVWADFAERSKVPGLVWGIVAQGRLVHVHALGVQDIEARRPVTVTSLFRIASMTKAFTALTVLKLRDEGRLQLDALAEIYVPEMRGWVYPTRDSPRIRVRDLLHHTAGLVSDDPWGDRQSAMPEAEFTRLLQQGVPFSRPPATAMEYSNLGYALLGRIISTVSDASYAEAVAKLLLQPLGMDESGFDCHASPLARRALGYRWDNNRWQREQDLAHGAFGAMGGLQTHATDYAKWLTFLLDAWPARDDADNGPVRRATVRELVQGLNFPELWAARSSTSSDKTSRRAAVYGMGLTAIVDSELGLYLTHGGGYPGYGSHMMLLPEQGAGLFVFANRTYAGPGPALAEVAQRLKDAGYLRSRALGISLALADAYRAVITIFQAGDIEAAGDVLATNLLLDWDAPSWARYLAQLKQRAGECDAGSPIVATGALSGDFTWPCSQGRIKGSVLLAPTHPPRIQEIKLNHESA